MLTASKLCQISIIILYLFLSILFTGNFVEVLHPSPTKQQSWKLKPVVTFLLSKKLIKIINPFWRLTIPSIIHSVYLIELYCWHSTVTKVPRLSRAAPLASIGEWIFICRTWVSRPFWWLLRTAIWIMKVLIGRSWMSLRGIRTHPLGSLSSITSTSWRSLKLVPALIDILKQKMVQLIKHTKINTQCLFHS